MTFKKDSITYIKANMQDCSLEVGVGGNTYIYTYTTPNALLKAYTKLVRENVSTPAELVTSTNSYKLNTLWRKK